MCVLVAIASTTLTADDRQMAIQEATVALQRGSATFAERIVNEVIAAHPNDAAGFALLGAVLDAEKRYPEAGASYRRAIQLAPPSPELLNKYATHQLAVGDIAGASATLLKFASPDGKQNRAAAKLLRCVSVNVKESGAQ